MQGFKTGGYVNSPAPVVVRPGPWSPKTDVARREVEAAQLLHRQHEQVKEFEANLKFEINRVKSLGLPQGYIVALLHAFALQETQEIIKD